MTQTETVRRLTAAEDEIRTLRAELSALRVAAAETRLMVLLAADESPEARGILSALTASPEFGTPQTEPADARPRLRLVRGGGQDPQPAPMPRPRPVAVDSVGVQDMDEALRRVRGTGAR
ncbi:hypothetical protein QFZ56_003808 [Streptomyces achromogenes]|uniref:Uncharacterized protein n=1 Tax=Streptomyces achromogenes TaxID=67255 RepID=A0ABU0Q2E6_STRAH|nr:hypothetical protein [Streptomyces achromogenes]MDQ0684845.1 hypothetical protein [Streptomyces achromogenes]